MADTPAETPKRRRAASKPAATAAGKPGRPRTVKVDAPKAEEPKAPARRRAKASAAAPAAAIAKSAAPAAAPAEPATPAKPPRKPRAPAKPAAAKASADKPRRAPRKAAASAPAPKPASAGGPTLVERARDVLPDTPPKAGLFAALGTLAAVGGAFFLWRSSRAEEPDYEVLEADGSIEIRRYPSLVTAGTEQRGQRKQALNEGFRVLADYIFAKSRAGAKLPMTAPVLSDSDGGGSWRTRFIMPTGKARAELPAVPAGVDLVSEPSRRVAALRFSGSADDATLETKENVLRSWLQMRSFPSEGRPVYAFYNAPFLPGPLRRNEVMIVLSEEGGMG